MRLTILITLSFSSALPSAACATVIEYTDKVQWQTALSTHSMVDFTDLPNGTLVTSQYSDLGLTFTDGADFIHYSASYLNDGVGLRGGLPGQINITFAMLQYGIAVDFPGAVAFHLYRSGVLIYESNPFDDSESRFAGIVERTGFDGVRIFDPYDSTVAIDDLYFGPPIPGPGALLAFLAAGALPIRTRRRT